MKRRNFLSGLLAAPLALKARLAQCFGRKPVELCNAPIGNRVAWARAEPGSPEGQTLIRTWKAVGAYADAFRSQGINLDGYSLVIGPDKPISIPPSAHCSLPRGHKGGHVLLNPR